MGKFKRVWLTPSHPASFTTEWGFEPGSSGSYIVQHPNLHWLSIWNWNFNIFKSRYFNLVPCPPPSLGWNTQRPWEASEISMIWQNMNEQTSSPDSLGRWFRSCIVVLKPNVIHFFESSHFLIIHFDVDTKLVWNTQLLRAPETPEDVPVFFNLWRGQGI